MPTDGRGLLLLIVLLLPGLTYVALRDRRSSERRPTAFRESGAVVFCSLVTEFVTLVLFAVLRWLLPGLTPDVGRLVREGGEYARQHYVSLGWWGVGLLAFACGLAAAASVRAAAHAHPSQMSAWWVLFDGWYPGETVTVGCLLEDGAYLEGRLASFNVSAEDAPDRDLVLMQPLKYRAPGETEAHPLPWSAGCVSASRIVTLFVSYPIAGAEGAEGAEGEASGQAGR
ncbi:DUF6338 family protein [Streptomyces broussonetiae]|uniref:DUF6338 family protein n=1 Tax=Streptomyces broussonetiae TaxID=2686304 RepID=A0ABV5EM62_9ACTN